MNYLLTVKICHFTFNYYMKHFIYHIEVLILQINILMSQIQYFIRKILISMLT